MSIFAPEFRVVGLPPRSSFCTGAIPRVNPGASQFDRAFALAVGGYFQSLIDRDLLKPLPLA